VSESDCERGTARPGETELVGEGAAYDGSVLCAGSWAQAQAAGVSQISLWSMVWLLGAPGRYWGSCNRPWLLPQVGQWSCRGCGGKDDGGGTLG
jgi:hypothetical protein